MNQPQLSVVIPLFNESENIQLLYNRLKNVIDNLAIWVEVVLVNDGSRDNTEVLIQQIAFLDQRFVAVSLAKNHGHQIAVSAGLATATASEAIFIIDGDLQNLNKELL